MKEREGRRVLDNLQDTSVTHLIKIRNNIEKQRRRKGRKGGTKGERKEGND